MQLKQVFSTYYGQIDEDMRGTLKEYDDFERAYNERDVVALRIMLKKVNFIYKKNEEPIKTMWQATKDLILMKQHKNTFENMMRILRPLITSFGNSTEVTM